MTDIPGAVAATLFDSGYPIFDPRAEVQKQKAIEVGRQAAAKKTFKAPEVVKGLAALGPYAYGDLPAPWVQRHRGFPYLCMHPVLLGRHVVMVGKPGSGKTTSLLQLAYLAAKVYGWRVYFLDGKGDARTMREFTSLMLAAAVPPGEIGAFRVRPFDGWRTSGDFQQGYSQLLNRLMGAVTFTEPYYRDTTRLYLSRALKVGEALPRSSSELLERLARLVDQAPADQKQEARGAHNRYESLFDSFPGQFDGGWSFNDHRAGYVLLKGLANRDEAQNLAGYIFERFKQFATDMKRESDKVLLIVDEFPAVMGDSDTAGMRATAFIRMRRRPLRPELRRSRRRPREDHRGSRDPDTSPALRFRRSREACRHRSRIRRDHSGGLQRWIDGARNRYSRTSLQGGTERDRTST